MPPGFIQSGSLRAWSTPAGYDNRVSRHLKGQHIKNENVSHPKLAFLLFDAHPHNWSETLDNYPQIIYLARCKSATTAKERVVDDERRLFLPTDDNYCAIVSAKKGETVTDFFNTGGSAYNADFNKMETPEKVVQVGLRALEQGCPSVVSGRQNTLLANASRFFPRGLVVRLAMQASQQRQRTKSA
jgi:hypothetical protein